MSRPDAIPGEEYEYAVPLGDPQVNRPEADVHDSYEGLPPDYTLGHNMLAGAFAGIAVRIFFFCAPRTNRLLGLISMSGTLGDVSS